MVPQQRIVVVDGEVLQKCSHGQGGCLFFTVRNRGGVFPSVENEFCR